MNNRSNRLSAALGITFVWFTTQFGGGFASGAQLKSYFIKYGIWCLITCVAAQAINAFYNGIIVYYCKKHGTYNYRSFCDGIYGRFAPVLSNLYEFIYIVVLLVVPAVAYSTGGSTLSTLLGVPYMLCTALIGVFIFIVSIYGTAIVRKTATALSVLIVAGLLVVFVPNILVEWKSIGENIGMLAANPAPIGPALIGMFIYSASQTTPPVAILSQHAGVMESEKDSFFTMVIGFLVNSAMIFISILGLLAIINNPDYEKSSLPVLLLVQNGVGGSFLTPILSVLIILGSVSTAVNMVSAGTIRVCSTIDKEFDPDGKPTSKVILITLILCIVGFAVAQFGLLPLVTKGYGFLGYMAIPVIMIPHLVYFICRKKIDP